GRRRRAGPPGHRRRARTGGHGTRRGHRGDRRNRGGLGGASLVAYLSISRRDRRGVGLRTTSLGPSSRRREVVLLWRYQRKEVVRISSSSSCGTLEVACR